MTIKLRIDNCDALPDGGPLEYSCTGSGFDLGRETHLDWTLPDDSRYISGRHCEIRFDRGQYWLHDISRNGTFLNGAQDRVKSPYQLQNGDRIAVGHYIVEVSIQNIAGQGVDEFDAVVQDHAAQAEDIWAIEGHVPEPISRRDLMPPKKQGQRAPDFSQQYLELPEMQASEIPSLPVAGMDQNPFGIQQEPPVPPATPLPYAAELVPAQGIPRQEVPVANPAQPNQAQLPITPQPPANQLPVQQAQPTSVSEFLQHIATGAGVSPDCFAQSDPAELGQEIGAAMRVVIEQMAQLLKARAAAKTMAKSSNRTMISAMDNNPLKFVPTTEEMFDVMFGKRKAGYLGARASFEHGFADLKTHEFATYSAMQKALARLLEDFSPDSIEGKLNTSAFSSKGNKAWETYVTRWETMTEAHENGVLDVFLKYFAKAYDEASKSKKN